MGRQFGHLILEKVLEMKTSGISHRGIASELGFTHDQINKLIERHNKNQRKAEAGLVLNRKGRPPKDYVAYEQDKLADLRYKLNRKDYRIRRLEMEVELLRDFLKETGRK